MRLLRRFAPRNDGLVPGIFGLIVCLSSFLTATPHPQTVPMLRKYCAACHAVGALKFITSADDAVVWRFIHSQPAPSAPTWAKSMTRVLNWPTQEPPNPEVPIEPGKDWMPKGKKRFEIVQEFIGGEDVREFLLAEISQGP